MLDEMGGGVLGTKKIACSSAGVRLPESKPTHRRSRFYEIARVLVRLDHVARFIVNANHGMM